MSVPKDLEYLRTVVLGWPETAGTVRLDADGEVCFLGYDYEYGCDFYTPDGKGHFTPWDNGGYIEDMLGREYTYSNIFGGVDV